MKETMKLARQIIWRYRHETPLGNQPHMIAHEADEAIERIDQALAKQEQSLELVEWRDVDNTGIPEPVYRLKAKQTSVSEVEQGEPVGFCKVLTMDDVADIIVNAQSRTPPYEINYMTVMQLTEKAVLEKFK